MIRGAENKSACAIIINMAIAFGDNYQKLISDRQIDRIFEPGARQTQAQENFAMWSKAVERAKDWIE